MSAESRSKAARSPGPVELGAMAAATRPVVVGVAGAHVLGGSRRGQPAGRVLADRLQQPVRLLAGLGDHERLVDQRAHVLQHVERVDLVVARDRLGRVEGEATGEHRQPIEHRALGVGQQLVGPVDRGLQRLVARHRGAAPAGEHPEPLVEPLEDLGRRDGPGPGRGQLDGERDAVEPAAQLDHGRRRRRVERELGPRRPRPGDEELDRVAVGIGRQRRDRHHPFGRDAEAFTARGDHPHVGRAGRDRVHDRRDARDQVLAVVDHQQQVAAAATARTGR